MENNNLRNPRLYLAFVFVLILTIVFSPKSDNFNYKYQKGKPWIYETLISHIDFPILKTEQEIQTDKASVASMVVPFYNYNDQTHRVQAVAFSNFASSIDTDNTLVTDILDLLDEIYKVGVIPKQATTANEDRLIIIQNDKTIYELPLSRVYDTGSAEEVILNFLSDSYPDKKTDSLYQRLQLDKYISPNLLYDEAKTASMHRENIESISAVKGMVYTGQLIVTKGEVITQEVKDILDSYRHETQLGINSSKRSSLSYTIGHSIFMFIVLFILFVTIYFLDRKAIGIKRVYFFLLMIFALMYLVSVFIAKYDQKMLYVIPYSVFSLYLVAFFKRSSAFSLYTIMLLPIIIISNSGLELYFINLFAGMIAVYSFEYLNKGWLQFISSLLVLVGLVLAQLSYLLINNDFTALSLDRLLYLCSNAVLLIASYPLIYLFEMIFSLVSKSRLRDLSDSNSSLLQEMSKKAPGTFQHSLQVANIAAEAASEIESDIALARVGALYHDIGKCADPLCYIENQPQGYDYHKDLTPVESAQQILKHVTRGIELGKRNKLPNAVIDFVRSHHAKSIVSYFYTMHCNNGGDPNDIEMFRYKGNLPDSKEQVIVMLADTLEAASRTLSEYSDEKISNLVDNIVTQKLESGQLVNADISIKELNIVKESFKRQLQQIYHSRIAYPSLNDNKKKK